MKLVVVQSFPIKALNYLTLGGVVKTILVFTSLHLITNQKLLFRTNKIFQLMAAKILLKIVKSYVVFLPGYNFSIF
ncbi:hypothetical protein J2X69_004023 [Algoriphagus sp. 4150]|nr:hypothetical protein [Algoriphagus sp. 4150]